MDKRSHYISIVFRVVCIFFSTLLLLPTLPNAVPCLGLRLKVSQRETAVGMKMQVLKGALNPIELQSRMERNKKSRVRAISNSIVPLPPHPQPAHHLHLLHPLSLLTFFPPWVPLEALESFI